MKKKLAIIGSGDLGQQIAHFASLDNHYEVIGFYDDFKEKRTIVNGYPCLGKLSSIPEHFEANVFEEIIIAIGYKHLAFKKSLYLQLKNSIPFATIIHSSAIIDKTAHIGQGTVIYPGNIIDQNVRIGENILMNVGCCIAHDTLIGDHSFLSPRVSIAGFVHIGEVAMLGINSTVIDNIIIAPQVQLGGGAVVIKNIDKSGLYVGNPTRFIR